MKKVAIIILVLNILLPSVVCANYVSYYDNNTYYEDSSVYPYSRSYCAPKEGVLSKIRNAFFGAPTGFTPPILPSSYLNSYGPSYMRGFYGNNGWNSHNTYSPIVTGSGIHILD